MELGTLSCPCHQDCVSIRCVRSSLHATLYISLGPCSVVEGEGHNNLTTKPNPYSWNEKANVFFLDEPIGGLSSSLRFSLSLANSDLSNRCSWLLLLRAWPARLYYRAGSGGHSSVHRHILRHLQGIQRSSSPSLWRELRRKVPSSLRCRHPRRQQGARQSWRLCYQPEECSDRKRNHG